MNTDSMVLNYIINYKRTHGGNSPSMRDIEMDCDLASVSTAHAIVSRLRGSGRLVPPTESTSKDLRIPDSMWVYYGPENRLSEEDLDRLILLLGANGYDVSPLCCGGNCACHTESNYAMVGIA